MVTKVEVDHVVATWKNLWKTGLGSKNTITPSTSGKDIAPKYMVPKETTQPHIEKGGKDIGAREEKDP